MLVLRAGPTGAAGSTGARPKSYILASNHDLHLVIQSSFAMIDLN